MVKKKMEDYENLIGKEAYGFKFQNNDHLTFAPKMESYIGKLGIIKSIFKAPQDGSLRIRIHFDDGEHWVYPASQVKHHLVPPIDINELFNEIQKL